MKENQVYQDAKKAISLCKNEINNKAYDSILKWAMTDNSFSEISQCYQFTNEAIDAYYQLLNLKNKNILTVCGSGDQVIYAMIKDAQNIDVFDSNKLTYYLLFLKISIIQGLNYMEFLEFMNLYSNKNNQIKYYKKIRDLIKQKDAKAFWDTFFKEETNIFPALFMGKHNDIDSNSQDWLQYFNQTKSRVSYLNEEYFYYTQNKLKLAKSIINFKLVDLLNVNKYFNKKYDFINCSNIINYIDDRNTIINFFKNIIEYNLNTDGTILLNYYWHLINKESNEYQMFNELKSNIISLNTQNNKYESALIYKK